MDFDSKVALPVRIERLTDLARDLSWSWNSEVRRVFRRLDYPLWRLTAHNPVRMLQLLSAEQLQSAAANPSFLRHYDAAVEELDRARGTADTWWRRRYPDLSEQSVAYFSAEFALHQSLAIYAGGLGVLAGDHCK